MITYKITRKEEEKYSSIMYKDKRRFNSAIEELFLSEACWIRWQGQTLSVIPKTKSLELKTSLNDKLANYTVEFEFAFNKINNVR